MKKINVAIIDPFFDNYGGAEVYIDSLNNYLNNASDSIESRIYTANSRVFKSKTVQIPKLNTYKKMIANIIKIIFMLKKDRNKYVILNDIYMAQFGIIFRLMGFTTYSIIHAEINNNRAQNNFIKAIIVKIRAFLINIGSHYIFSVPKTNLKFLSNRKTELIGNFIEVNSTRTLTDNISKEYDFIFCGRFVEIKNIKYMLQVFKRYVETINLNSKLVLLGKGNLENYIYEFIHDNNLENNIEVIGFLDREQTFSYYINSKCLLLFSKSEGFPTVILEALSVGTPCIATNVGSVSEVIEDGVNGYVIDLTDEEELIIDLMYEITNNYEDIKSNCIESVNKFDIQYVLSKIEKKII